jgi:medium-chain acyl-[acyl-carrier-protein] hydrolase
VYGKQGGIAGYSETIERSSLPVEYDMTDHQEIKYVWNDEYTVHSYEADMKGRAKVMSLCQFMQESALQHADHLGVGFPHLMEKNLIWILARQLIKIHSLPRWGDTIQISTWPTGNDRLFCYRDFRIRDSSHRVLCEATTVWFVIDLKTRMPRRTNPYFSVDTPDNIDQVFPEKLNKLPPAHSESVARSINVTYRDLDMNEHVNNVRYIDWIFDSFTFDFLKKHTLKELEINYVSEAIYGDEITAWYKENDNNSFSHSLVRGHDKSELCRARTSWKIDG